jgi:lipoprotein NlpI
MGIARILPGLVLLTGIALSTAAMADSAEDRAWKDCEQETDLDLRIVGCTRVLGDKDEEPADRAVAFNNRGNAHAARGDYPRAIADYDESSKLDPQFVWAYANRGRTYLFSGNVAKAREDFQQAVKIDSESPYLGLWLEIANRRLNAPNALEEAASDYEMTRWPAPVVRLYLGELTLPQTLAAAKGTADLVCEVNFYAGELALAKNKKDEAVRLFQTAAAGCPAGLIEEVSAKAELKALGVK